MGRSASTGCPIRQKAYERPVPRSWVPVPTDRYRDLRYRYRDLVFALVKRYRAFGTGRYRSNPDRYRGEPPPKEGSRYRSTHRKTEGNWRKANCVTARKPLTKLPTGRQLQRDFIKRLNQPQKAKQPKVQKEKK